APKPAVATEAQPARTANACQLPWPTSPTLGNGIVEGFYDRAAALAMIQTTQAQVHGKIDPNYIDNLRVNIRLPGGNPLVARVQKNRTVHGAAGVAFQSAFRNPNLPCTYIPPLTTADNGPPPAATPSIAPTTPGSTPGPRPPSAPPQPQTALATPAP